MSTANECIPYYEPGAAITAKAEAAVVGKRFVQVSDPAEAGAFDGLAATAAGGNIVCSHATAAGKALGVASYDAAIAGRFYVVGGPGSVVPVTAAEAITAGEEIEVGADGKAAVLAAGEAVGIALDSCDLGADCAVRLY